MTEQDVVKKEVRGAFEKYMGYYFSERNPEKTFSMFDEEIAGFGTGADEIAMDAGEFKSLYLRDMKEAPEPVDVQFDRIDVRCLTATVGLINAVISIKTKIARQPFEAEGLRVSAVFRKTGNLWLMTLMHISFPTAVHGGEESYPIKELEKRNRWLEEKVNEKTRELLDKNKALEDALAQVKKLSGLLPICASCKKVRNDNGYWQGVEEYIRQHSEAEFSHGICPDCMPIYYPNYAAKLKKTSE